MSRTGLGLGGVVLSFKTFRKWKKKNTSDWRLYLIVSPSNLAQQNIDSTVLSLKYTLLFYYLYRCVIYVQLCVFQIPWYFSQAKKRNGDRTSSAFLV